MTTEEMPETTAEMRTMLSDLLMEADEEWGGGPLVDSVRTFEEAALLTSDDGLVVRLANGAEFNVKVTQTRYVPDDDPFEGIPDDAAHYAGTVLETSAERERREAS